jgi:DNA-binding NtrC family response regulator
VILLAEHFLRRFSTKYGKSVRRIDGAARNQLLAYPWPGNVRELSHVIERAVLWSRDSSLTPEHLSLTAPRESSRATSTTEVHEGGSTEKAGQTETAPALAWEGADLTGVERSMIERAMQEAGGNQTRAAQRLGISRDTLRYRLKKFGLQGG